LPGNCFSSPDFLELYVPGQVGVQPQTKAELVAIRR